MARRHVLHRTGSPVIATSPSLDVLRHGWLDAVASLAPDQTGLAELVELRLETAITTRRLDEESLLDTAAEIETAASAAGLAESVALAVRMRRTVYEYLLALDATAVNGSEPAVVAETAAASALAELDEPAAEAVTEAELPAATPDPDEAIGTPEATAAPEAAAETETAADVDELTTELVGEPDHQASGLEALGSTHEPLAAEHEPLARDDEPSTSEPEPLALGSEAQAAQTDSDGTDPEPPARVAYAEPELDAGPVAELEPPVEHEPPMLDALAETEPEAPPEAFAPPDAPADAAPEEFEHLAPTDTLAQPETTAADSEPEATAKLEHDGEPRYEPPTWTPVDLSPVAPPAAAAADGPLPSAEPPAFVDPASDPAGDDAFVAPRKGFHITDDLAAPSPPIAIDDELFAPIGRVDAPPVPDAAAEPGWRVRPNSADARRDAGGRGDSSSRPAEDPFDTDSRLHEERRRIQDRLRRKKCDEAAAMLQSMAQETGGRTVAELAMDAGDRCRGLGKTNAALNCYLAASRADPIFELPLHRLADICIDDQDIELAVSYLERIARLHQMRGDEHGALRVYRRIVTVAPYREDILTMLMNARNTGQLSS